ncbi:MAG: PEP-CTERM sorting domain-containing protein [Luteolibacter sp.]
MLFLSSAPLARAAGTIYTTQSAFTAALNPGFYTETFSDSLNLSPDYLSATLSNGTYTAIATTKDIFGGSMEPYTTDLGGDYFLTLGGGSTFARSITLTFTSGNVNAIGGSFFLTNPRDGIVDAPITLTFSDGTSQVLNSQTNASFFGYIGTAPITSLTITSGASYHFPSIDNLILGSATAVPEPSVPALLIGAGTLSIALARRRPRNG